MNLMGYIHLWASERNELDGISFNKGKTQSLLISFIREPVGGNAICHMVPKGEVMPNGLHNSGFPTQCHWAHKHQMRV